MSTKIEPGILERLEKRLATDSGLLGRFLIDPVTTLQSEGIELAPAAAKALGKDTRAVREFTVSVLGAELTSGTSGAMAKRKRKAIAVQVLETPKERASAKGSRLTAKKRVPKSKSSSHGTRGGSR